MCGILSLKNAVKLPQINVYGEFMQVKEYVQDKLVCKVFSDRDSMGQCAAKMIGQKMRELLAQQDEINMVFAAAPSQNDVLRYLILEDVDWTRVTAFHMDEYVGLQEGSEKTFRHYLDVSLFSKVKMKAVYYIGSSPNTEGLCKRYEELLRDHPIDIVCLGIGENGHIAFNDPDVADFLDKKVIKLVCLDERCRKQQVNDKTFDTLEDVPKYAITLTIPTLISAKYMYCVVPTVNKAEAVYRTMNDPVDHSVPATILRTHPHAIMFTDPDSAKLLMQAQ